MTPGPQGHPKTNDLREQIAIFFGEISAGEKIFLEGHTWGTPKVPKKVKKLGVGTPPLGFGLTPS